MSSADAAPPTSAAGNGPRPESGDEAASALDHAGRALFRLGRFFSKRPLHRLLTKPTGRAVEVSRVLVVQAIEAGPAEPGGEVTVGLVAGRLDVDPSTASRLVAETIRDGYLSRAASRVDGRSVRLELTDAGRALAEDARRYQRAVFEHVTRGWSERERREFARLFVEFAAAAEAYATLETPDAH